MAVMERYAEATLPHELAYLDLSHNTFRIAP
jgi:hypothetical protein